MNSAKQALHLGVVGPLPPPAGGMATQTRQLVTLFREEQIDVTLVQNNKPYRPKLIEKIKGFRALFRLIPYLSDVWKLAGKVNVIHLMANSGWSWQLFSAPVVWIGWLRKTPVIVNYRGGEAQSYFEQSFQWIHPSLKKASLIVVPSGYLKKVFADFGLDTHVIPNIVDLERFKPISTKPQKPTFKLIITRNLEVIYGIETAIKAVALAKEQVADLCLEIAGTGPQQKDLQKLVETLGLQQQVKFVGRLDAKQIVEFYQSADVMLNPTTVDNMPNSVLEALACGVPVITTDVGGIPFIVEHEKTALMVPVGDEVVMASQIVSLYQSADIRKRLVSNGLAAVQPYAWPCVRGRWIDLYQELKVIK
jgi:glycosyltransferase involved in cell wall biosynthesis